ncbi:MAG: hypothetical protein LBT12_01500 [Oscillospiraceae bacterium]|jgi:hypothetical protein|nr:hypothetical protein [Oscillospiraceae bacterium]
MAVSTVTVKLDGAAYAAVYNPVSGNWELSISAPAMSSFLQSGHYYPIQISARNDTGNSKAITTTSGDFMDALKLYVTESVKPVVEITAPAPGGYVPTASPVISLLLLEEDTGSGINLASLAITVNGRTYGAESVTATPVTNGYACQFSAAVLPDGAYTLTAAVADNDGNMADTADVSFVVDTIAPSVIITAPTPETVIVTRKLTAFLAGEVTDANPDIIVSLFDNDTPLGVFGLGADGAFSKEVSLTPGVNVLTVRAVDIVGNVTTASVTVTRIFDFAVVTDRTPQDVADAKQLAEKRWDDMTAAERDAFSAGLKGHYNVSDLLRVEKDVHFLSELLTEYGYNIPVTVKTDWQLGDIPAADDMNGRYLENVRRLYSSFYVYTYTPPPPVSILGFTYIQANNIEIILGHIYELILKQRKEQPYSGEIYSGEF